ncbi:MAG: DASS family sodium-coupled anion symporter [Prolixibacteraceae bacterium]|jgi:solute carrier family 13 (sodium-dependent dicarboxylate transporter), member 2/3/5|nr:DASS family sodium-coupled anion symporter [Prolixibacteraceae bacterium]MBT6005014.1 DASS family sodium-coupled anion symporter [Prolixibacteraceae bacterium]MBT6764876.1 DASS family sodium-coupled anion symporter [Prolixibacteraceae bacterium]MBT6999044.1 DASS family sodium-coupled anion symporter [Prolixibacteraceae bacterium]MBT7394457.1 DASS family sodium-coupled anion symporter [Prolixibacteraceae bacterium]
MSDTVKTKSTKIQLLALIVAPLISLFIILFTDLDPENKKVTYTFAIALLMAIWWITEAIPLAVTALLPVALFPLFGVVDGKTISAMYFNHLIFLFIGGFLMAFAMERWNLHRRIALKILIFFGISPGRILLGFMLATSFLSMWMSNTATAMMMVPIALSIIMKLEESLGDAKIGRYSIGLLLGIAYSASIGGIATLVGTPPNLSFARIISIIFPEMTEISFADWFIFAIPVTILIFAGAWLLLYLMYKPKESWENLKINEFKNEYDELGKPKVEEKIVFVLFLILAFLWIFRSGFNIQSFVVPGWSKLFNAPSYINDGTVAIFIALLLFIIPSKSQKGERIMNWETANRIPWNIVLLFGGGFALAQGFVDSGLSIWFGEQLAGLANVQPIVLTLANVTMMSLLTELTSNVATTEMILPILAGLSMTIKINPLLLMIPATLAASLAFMLPVATPPNAIIFGTNRIKIKDMVKTGILLNITGIIIATLVMYFWGTVVFDIDVTVFPEWAAGAVK